MTTIPAKVLDRFKESLSKIQKVIEGAKSRDINEADTVVIVSDILSSVFGFDKYTEITREYAIKNNYCDLAVKIDDKVKFLIEVKAIGINLLDKHYQQALDYGANLGIEWIILTNGVIWKVYKVKFEKPIRTDSVCEINFPELKLKNQADLEKLFILCKEGLKKNAIDEFTEYKLIVNKFYVSAILQNESVIEVIKKELRKVSAGIRAEETEILSIIKNEVLKRELLDTPEAAEVMDKYTKILKKAAREKAKAAGAKAEEKTADDTGSAGE